MPAPSWKEARQVDQRFQARRDTETPAAVGAVEDIGATPPADVDAIFVLQTAVHAGEKQSITCGAPWLERAARLSLGFISALLSPSSANPAAVTSRLITSGSMRCRDWVSRVSVGRCVPTG